MSNSITQPFISITYIWNWRHDDPFGIMTVFDIMTNFIVVSAYSWHHDDLFDVMMCILRHDVFLTSWNIFLDVMTCFFTLWHTFCFWFSWCVLTSWWTLWHHDAFWCHNELSFDIMMYFPYFWCYDILFYFMTYILTSWSTFHIVWPHDVFLDFNILMYLSTL